MDLIPEINAKHPEEMAKLCDVFRECEVLFWFDCLPTDDKMVNQIKRKAKQTGMQIYAVHLPSYFINKSFAETQKLVNVIHKMNAVFEPKVVNMHCLYGRREETKNSIKYVLEKIPEEITFTIENMARKNANLREPETVPAFLHGLKEFKNFGLCLDTTHLPVSDEKKHTASIIKFIELSGNKLKHLHFSDVAKDRKTGEWLKHQPMGTGIINWGEIKSKLTAQKYAGKATIEYLLEHKGKVKEAAAYWNSL